MSRGVGIFKNQTSSDQHVHSGVRARGPDSGTDVYLDIWTLSGRQGWGCLKGGEGVVTSKQKKVSLPHQLGPKSAWPVLRVVVARSDMSARRHLGCQLHCATGLFHVLHLQVLTNSKGMEKVNYDRHRTLLMIYIFCCRLNCQGILCEKSLVKIGFRITWGYWNIYHSR